MPTDSDLESEEQCCEDDNPNLHKQTKYIVFRECLLKLVSRCCCSGCGSKRLSKCKREVENSSCGIVGRISATWPQVMYSCRQQRYLQVPLLVVLHVLSHMAVRAINARTFFRHQVSILHTTIIMFERHASSGCSPPCRLREMTWCVEEMGGRTVPGIAPSTEPTP